MAPFCAVQGARGGMSHLLSTNEICEVLPKSQRVITVYLYIVNKMLIQYAIIEKCDAQWTTCVKFPGHDQRDASELRLFGDEHRDGHKLKNRSP
jgi:hypothetical protein